MKVKIYYFDPFTGNDIATYATEREINLLERFLNIYRYDYRAEQNQPNYDNIEENSI
jgi:hypothetical protein